MLISVTILLLGTLRHLLNNTNRIRKGRNLDQGTLAFKRVNRLPKLSVMDIYQQNRDPTN